MGHMVLKGEFLIISLSGYRYLNEDKFFMYVEALVRPTCFD